MGLQLEDIIYLDNNATTKVDSRVVEAMMPFFSSLYANAASNHEFGVEVNQYVKDARKHVASLLNAESNEIIFTSGSTEAINLALKGLAERSDNERNHIITCQTEHHAVLDTCKHLEERGFIVDYLPVRSDGTVDIQEIFDKISESTLVVCIMLANNETGVIQDVKSISEIAHKYGAYMMTDATQAVGKIPIDVEDLGVDLMCFSAHKFYGPKGIGGLFVRSKRPNKVKIDALIHGGGHERKMRSGTLNVPLIIGLGKAAEIAKSEMIVDSKRIQKLRDILESGLLRIPNSKLNGSEENRMYNTLNVCFKGADADALIIGIKPITVSNGSACTSTKIEPSHVLTSMGLTPEDAYSSIRISLGKYNNESEIMEVVERVKEVVDGLRKMTSTQ